MQQQQKTAAPQRFERITRHDSRVAQGRDYDGDAWQDTLTQQLRWVVPGADPNVAPEAILVITPTCRHCGSDEVTLDGNARWDVHMQDWRLDAVFDDAYCGQCGEERDTIDVAKPVGPSTVKANTLTRAEVMAIFERTGDTLSFSDVVQALASKRDTYDLTAVQAAQEGSREGDLEVDENALTSRSDDSEGCYVMAWTWVPAPDQV